MLRVEKLERRAGAFRLTVDQWVVEQGSYVVIVGPSGAGKTMLLETLAGLHAPDAGRIWIEGREATHEVPERRGIGFVYQDCWLFPHLSVRGNIEFGRRYHRRPGVEAAVPTETLVNMMDLAGMLDRKPITLSGGERQRVAVARALATRPRLMFLDEPLGNLDPSARERVAGELQRCHSDFGMTTIHVTHDHAEARMLGKAAAVMLDGRLEQSGPTDDVFERPATEKLARFLGCQNVHAGVARPGQLPDRATVQVADQTLESASTLIGGVSVCVRPEHVQVIRADGADRPGPGLRGTIKVVSDRGPLVRLVMDVSGQDWISLVSRSEAVHHGFAVDQDVVLQVPADACHLIRAEGAS